MDTVCGGCSGMAVWRSAMRGDAQARASAVHLRVVAAKPLLAAIAKATEYVHQEQAAHNLVARTANARMR